MVVREKNCYYAIALTDFFVFLSCAEEKFISNRTKLNNYTLNEEKFNESDVPILAKTRFAA